MEKGKPGFWSTSAYWIVSSGGFAIGAPATSQAANITALLFKGGSSAGAAPTTASPIEKDGSSEGAYTYPITSTESDTTFIELMPTCSTSGVEVRATPQSFHLTPGNFNVLNLSAGGSVTNVDLVATCTTNTDMITDYATTAQVDAIDVKIDALPTTGEAEAIAAAALTAYDGPTNAEMEARTLEAASYVTTADTGVTDAKIDALNDLSTSDVWDAASAITLDFGTLLERSYQLLNNEQNIVNATGAAALRNIGDTADLATWTISDDDSETIKTEGVWP